MSLDENVIRKCLFPLHWSLGYLINVYVLAVLVRTYVRKHAYCKHVKWWSGNLKPKEENIWE